MSGFDWPEPERPDVMARARLARGGRGEAGGPPGRFELAARVARGDVPAALGRPLTDAEVELYDGTYTVDGFRVESCRSCMAPIVWAVTQDGTGKVMPVDGPLTDDGNVFLQLSPAGTVLAHVLGQAALFDDGPRHRPHFATCPDADSWRSRRAAGR